MTPRPSLTRQSLNLKPEEALQLATSLLWELASSEPAFLTPGEVRDVGEQVASEAEKA